MERLMKLKITYTVPFILLLFICSCKTPEPTNNMFMPRYMEFVDTAQVDTNYFYRSHS
jgi:hypothetical protein